MKEQRKPAREKDDFDQQYGQIQKAETQAGPVKYNALEPEGMENYNPIVVAGGWGINLGGVRDLGRTLYDNQRQTLILDFSGSKARSGESGVDDRAEALIQFLDWGGIQKADIITQSEGALFASLAAYNHPDRFENLVLAAPAGMIGQDSVLKLAGRFAPNVARSSSKDMLDNPGIASRINLGVLSMTGKHPVESVKRVQNLANYTIDGLLYALHSKGIKVGVIQANADSVFPPKRLQANVKPMGQFANVCSYASFIRKDAGHQELFINSEQAGLAAVQMLDSLTNTNLEPRGY